MIILVAIGANLPGPNGSAPIDTCRHAVRLLSALSGLRLVGVSRWYETEPVPPSGQPPYVNAVAYLEADAPIDPAVMLAHTQAIEDACGRRRSIPNAARTLDLDLIAMGSLVRAAPDPILPHPRAHERAFVLAPLADVAPGWVHPLLGRSVEDLLAAADREGVRVMA